ncbi:MAG: histidine kinase [Arcicella sp.]|nr:histidine kinase [Arcicella sp.]
MNSSIPPKINIVKLITILSVGGTLGYFGYILFRNLFQQSPEGFADSGGYIRYLIGWLIILGGIILTAFLNYKYLFLRLFYHENAQLKTIYWVWISGFSILIFNLLQIKTEFFPDYADENIFITFLLISFIVLYGYIADYFRTKRLQIQLLKEKTDAELSVLKAQINPHFLFNALNTIYNEAHREENEHTANLIEKLSGILRFSVEESQHEFTSVEREIKFLEQYLTLQKARLPERENIKIQTNISYDEEPALIAPFLIIPFLENAFLYGVSMDKDCFIDINVNIENQQVYLKVSNSILPNNSAKKGIGTGIINVQKRLDLQYENKHKLLINNELNIFRIELKVDLGNQI